MSDLDKLLIELTNCKDVLSLNDNIKEICENNLTYLNKILLHLNEMFREGNIRNFYYEISNEIISNINWRKFTDDEIKKFLALYSTTGINDNLIVVLSNIYPKILQKDSFWYGRKFINLIHDKINRTGEFGYFSQEQLHIICNTEKFSSIYETICIGKRTIINMENLYKPIIRINIKFDILYLTKDILFIDKVDKLVKNDEIKIHFPDNSYKILSFDLKENDDCYQIISKDYLFPPLNKTKFEVTCERIIKVNYDEATKIVGNFLIKDLINIVESYLY